MLTPSILTGPLFGHGGFTWFVLINYPFHSELDGHVNHMETEHMKQYPWNWSNWQQYVAKAES